MVGYFIIIQKMDGGHFGFCFYGITPPPPLPHTDYSISRPILSMELNE